MAAQITIDHAQDLVHCLTTLADILRDKELSPEENIKVKYTRKVVDQLVEDMKQETQNDFYILADGKVVGKVTGSEVTINALFLGKYSINPHIEKGKIIAYNLEEIK